MAHNPAGDTYGDVVEFTTAAVPPSVTTGPATGVTSSGATLNGDITDTGGDDCNLRGFRYRVKGGGDPWTDWAEVGTFGTGAFSHPVAGLDHATTYEYQALARNPESTSYGDPVEFTTAPLPEPKVNSVSPSWGPPGTRVTVKGADFGDERGSSTITVGGVRAQVVSWSDDRIVIIVPDGSPGGAVVVTTRAGGSNTDKDFAVVLSTWYLAEGTNAWEFKTYINIENPNDEGVTVRVTYLDPNPQASGKGVVATRDIKLPPLSQTSISSEPDIGAVDFSTTVECLEGKTIAVDRTMYWTGNGVSAPGAHCSVGVTSPSAVWYLPEGSSAWGFETWTLVQNPFPRSADVTLTYMTEAGPIAVPKRVPANSRATFSMISDIGKADASIQVESDVPVVAERSMYRNDRREGSCSVGVTGKAENFYLAEGSTAWGFTTYLLIQNPNNVPATVTVFYLTPAGPVREDPFTMEANARRTIRVNDVEGLSNTDASIQVYSPQGIIAERAMYWDNGTGEACHDSVGLARPHRAFMLPDGQTSGGWQTYTLVQNPNETDVDVRITYLPEGKGTPVSFTDNLPADTRHTYDMSDKIESGRASVLVQVTDPAGSVTVERSMYLDGKSAGTNTMGGWVDWRDMRTGAGPETRRRQ